MAKPLISAESIYDEALEVLATEGAAGLHARNLSTRLRCSTKTLYQQVGNRETMIRGLVAHAFATIDLDFDPGENWQTSVRAWCMALRGALLARPDLCRLMTTSDRTVVIRYVTRLIRILTTHGFDDELAVRSGGVLVHVTLSMTLADLAAPGEWDQPDVFATAVDWLILGMSGEQRGA